MKKVIGLILVIVMMATMLCACGEETYYCGWCSRKVTQKPVAVTVFGQDVNICDSCAEDLEALGADLD